jgi:hypothetical protein
MEDFRRTVGELVGFGCVNWYWAVWVAASLEGASVDDLIFVACRVRC